MSYLTGIEIEKRVQQGEIKIEPFNPACVGPNSVDLHLHEDLLCYRRTLHHGHHGHYLDMTPGADPPKTFKAPRETDGSYFLVPGELYLGRTLEKIGSDSVVPMIEGRSSVGRFGVQVHMTAGVGDLGFFGTITLEIAVVRPVRINPGTRICQVLFSTVEGEPRLYQGRYQGQVDPTASRFALSGFEPRGEAQVGGSRWLTEQAWRLVGFSNWQWAPGMLTLDHGRVYSTEGVRGTNEGQWICFNQNGSSLTETDRCYHLKVLPDLSDPFTLDLLCKYATKVTGKGLVASDPEHLLDAIEEGYRMTSNGL